jgi:uncharacterized membrane protein YfcA
MLLITGGIFAIIRDATFSLGHWVFSLKYLKSSLQMPALFGGQPVSERTNKRLKQWNISMYVILILLPVACYGCICYAKSH